MRHLVDLTSADIVEQMIDCIEDDDVVGVEDVDVELAASRLQSGVGIPMVLDAGEEGEEEEEDESALITGSESPLGDIVGASMLPLVQPSPATFVALYRLVTDIAKITGHQNVAPGDKDSTAKSSEPESESDTAIIPTSEKFQHLSAVLAYSPTAFDCLSKIFNSLFLLSALAIHLPLNDDFSSGSDDEVEEEDDDIMESVVL